MKKNRLMGREGELHTKGMMAYKYKLPCYQVSSDHYPDTMRLLALLLMVGAAGKDS